MKIFIGENTKKAMETLMINHYPFSETTLKKNYKSIIKKHHPDTNKQKEAEEKTKQINSAYDLLKNLAMTEPTDKKANIIKEQHEKEKEDIFIFWEKCKPCHGTGKRVIQEYSDLFQKRATTKFRVETCFKCQGVGETKLEIFNPVIPKGAILK